MANLCLLHQQQYDPHTGWCPYCGEPPRQSAPVPVGPTPPVLPYTVGDSYPCPLCGGAIFTTMGGDHVCPRPGVRTITTAGSGTMGTAFTFPAGLIWRHVV